MAFNTGARLAMVPNLMEREYLPSALALDSALFNVSRFLGPALAGVIIAVWGVAAAFIVNAVTFIVFLWALTAIRMRRDRQSVWEGKSVAGRVKLGGRRNHKKKKKRI